MTIFVKLGPIVGDVTDQAHAGWVHATTFAWGVDQAAPGPGPSGVVAAGKATLEPARFTSQASIASPPLFLACTRGTVLPEVDVDFTRAAPDGTQQAYLQLRLRQVLVSSYAFGTDEQGAGTESVALTYGQIQVSYTPVGPTGQLGTAVVAGWDRLRNVAV